jgi:hypothetical protein
MRLNGKALRQGKSDLRHHHKKTPWLSAAGFLFGPRVGAMWGQIAMAIKKGYSESAVTH